MLGAGMAWEGVAGAAGEGATGEEGMPESFFIVSLVYTMHANTCCNIPICTYCIHRDHSKHKYINLENEIKSIKKRLNVDGKI